MNIAVYCGSSPTADPHFISMAEGLGTWIGAHGHTLIYGGSSIGLMGAISAAVLASGGSAIGVEPRFFIEAGVAQHDLTELIVVDDMTQRKAKMIELADVFVALPGGVGTLEEITEIMSRLRLRMEAGPCYLLNAGGFYDGMEEMLDRMERASFITPEDRRLYRSCTSLAELEECLDRHTVMPGIAHGAPVVPESNLGR